MSEINNSLTEEYEVRFQELLRMSKDYKVIYSSGSGYVAHGSDVTGNILDQDSLNNVLKTIDSIVVEIKNKISLPDAKEFVIKLNNILKDLTRLEIWLETTETSYDHHGNPMHSSENKNDYAGPVREKAKYALDQVKQLLKL